MYISFDEMPDTTISKEREACFTSGSDGEPLAKYITDARTKHAENVNALRKTIDLFGADEPKRRLHGKVSSRLEQERKWVKHFDVCINEHKKGVVIAKLKAQLDLIRKEAIKKDRDMRILHEAKMEELRKQCRVQYRKEWDDELKVKSKKKDKPKKRWYDWLINLFKTEEEEEEEVTVVRAKMVAKTAVPAGHMSAKQKREFYMARREAEAKS